MKKIGNFYFLYTYSIIYGNIYNIEKKKIKEMVGLCYKKKDF